MSYRYLLLLLCLPFLAKANTPLASVPITIQENLIFFRASVNGSEPLNIMFDSGAGVTVIDPVTADKLNLVASGTARIHTSGKTVESKTFTNNELNIGGLIIEGLTIDAIPLEHLSELIGYHIDLIMGYDLFALFVLETDLNDAVLRLYDSKAFQYAGDGERIDMFPLNQNHIAVPVEVEHKDTTMQLELTVDTGASDYMVLNNRTIKAYGLLDAIGKYRKVGGGSAEPTITTNIRTKLQRVRIGSSEWKRVPTVLTIDPINIKAGNRSTGDGLIGQALLLDFNVVYYFSEKIMYLEKR